MTATDGGKTAEARAKQRSASRRATFDKLAGKKRAQKEITFELDGDEVTLLFRAIGTADYDKLLSKHPPKADQKVEGATYNINTFGPALIAKTCVEPELTEEQARELWDSEEWSRGEMMTLFSAAVEVCNKGLDVPFSDNG